jgi:ATP-dependent protease Clp ATPase subunit
MYTLHSLLQKLIIVVIAITLIQYLFSLAIPLLIGCGLMMVVNKEYASERFTKLSPISLFNNARGRNIHAIVTLVAFLVLGAMTFLIIFPITNSIWLFSNGEITEGIIAVMKTALFACFAAMVFKLLLKNKKEFLMDFFEKANDRAALESFFGGEAKPVIIDAAELEAYCKSKVIGQDRVIKELALPASRRAKLNRKNKPLGVFLFVGSTGVGKTELAKAVADGAFNGRLIRFDMAEFGEAQSTQRLVGAPPGYVGSDQGGALTQAIKTMGNGVILFDEIEKAHPDVMKLLLGLLDEGRITEASTNETVNASKFVIILTSNANHRELGELVTKIRDPDDLRRAVKDTLRNVFSPEQLGRVDEVFCFGPLDRRGIASVVVKHLEKLQDDIDVEVVQFDSELLISAVMRHEKQSSYGIRELLRLVEKSVVDGMLECKEMGYKKVKILVDDEEIDVRGVDDTFDNESNSSQESTYQAQEQKNNNFR